MLTLLISQIHAENFAILILMNCIPENLLAVEQIYIKEYKRLAGTYNA